MEQELVKANVGVLDLEVEVQVVLELAKENVGVVDLGKHVKMS